MLGYNIDSKEIGMPKQRIRPALQSVCHPPFKRPRGWISKLGLDRNLDDPCCFFCEAFCGFLTDFLLNGSG